MRPRMAEGGISIRALWTESRRFRLVAPLAQSVREAHRGLRDLGAASLIALQARTVLATRKPGSEHAAIISKERLQSLAAVSVVFPYLLLAIAAAAPAVYLAQHNHGVFNSPDETARYMAAKELASEHRLYFKDKLTELNPQVPTGPRGFVQWNGRSVPIYSPGDVFLLGLAHVLARGNASYVLALIPALIIILFALLMRVLRGSRSPWFIGLAFLGVTPLWYWASRVYIDTGLVLLFVTAALVSAALCIQRRSVRWLAVASACLALGAFVRNAEAPLLLIFGIVLILGFLRATNVSVRAATRAVAVYASAQISFFVLPSLVLNWWINGSPLEFGYVIFDRLQFPNRIQPSSNPITFVLHYLRLITFPLPTDFNVLWHGVAYQVVYLIPVVAALGVAGIYLAHRAMRERLGWVGLELVLLALVYVMVSRSDPGTFLASASQPDLRVSVVRYWLPVYLALGIGMAYAATYLPKPAAFALVFGLAVSAGYQVWISSPESMTQLEQIVHNGRNAFEQFITSNTEPNAVVFAGSSSDKWIAPYRKTAGIWPGSATPELMANLANTATDLSYEGVPVYFVLGPGEPGDAATQIGQNLAPDYLGLKPTPMPDGPDTLWKVVAKPKTIPATRGSDGRPQGEVDSLGKPFEVTIAHLGPSENLITNPSFETDLSGWSGPSDPSIVQTDTESMFGQYSMEMQLQGNETGTAYPRRTTSAISGASLGATQGWFITAGVSVPDIYNAEAVLRAFVHDGQGNTIARPEVDVTNPTNGFETLTIQQGPLPAGTTTINVQLALVPLEHGATGTVLWDGIQLGAGTPMPGDYCDGNHGGCHWTGSPQESASARDNSIHSIVVASPSGSSVTIPGPFSAGDQLLFENGAVFVKSLEGAVRGPLASFPVPPKGTPIQFEIGSQAPPLLAISPIDTSASSTPGTS